VAANLCRGDMMRSQRERLALRKEIVDRRGRGRSSTQGGEGEPPRSHAGLLRRHVDERKRERKREKVMKEMYIYNSRSPWTSGAGHKIEAINLQLEMPKETVFPIPGSMS
jgi:hypothetical protein